MEVHSHLHSTGKKWTHYLWEFLMLFLAVFCGFLAENWREHLGEKKRLHEYIIQMQENIKADTGRCNNALRLNEMASSYLDSLRYEIENTAENKGKINRLYYYYLKSLRTSQVLFKQAAITQLKNSGNLRLINNKPLLNELLEYYDRWVSSSLSNRELVLNMRKDFSEFSINFINWQYFDKLIKRDTVFSYMIDSKVEQYYDSILIRTPSLVLLNTNASELRKWNNYVSEVERTLHSYNSLLRITCNLADTLLVHLNKEYHLK